MSTQPLEPTDSGASANPAELHPLDEALKLSQASDGRLIGHTHRGYWNQVGPYGGITAAVILQAILKRPERLGDPLSLTVNYAGPIAEGPFELDVTLARTNRNTPHWSVVLRQGLERQCVINAIAVFANRRAAWSALEASPPAVPAPETIAPYRRPVKSEWFNRYDMRPVRGLPTGENTDSLSHFWVRDDPPRPLDFAALAAICDTFVPRIFLRRPLLVPIATVSMNIYFHLDEKRLAAQGSSHLLAVARGQVFHEGFFDHEGQIWGADGHLFATTQQICWYRE